jgi:tetratricopeptide (TPR) repeat protein
VGLAAVYKITGNKKSLNDIINKGYQKLIEKFPTWPKKMFWGVMSNRQYLRMIDLKAEKYQKEGKKDEAEELYRLLLKLNPNDNQGINYQLAGLYAGITPDKISEMFEEGNEKQDWSKLKNLVVTQHKKHDFIPAELIEEDEDWEEDENEDANTFTWNLN